MIGIGLALIGATLFTVAAASPRGDDDTAKLLPPPTVPAANGDPLVPVRAKVRLGFD
jgi:hypothetical protein